MASMQPGETITPGGSAPEPPAETPADNQEPTQQEEPKQPESQWQYSGYDSAPVDLSTSSNNDGQDVSWTASEFIAHEKSTGWYMLLALVAVGVSAIVYLVTEDKVTSGMVLFVALMFGVVAARKPRVLDYEINSGGVRIGQKLYPYQVLKSFSVIQEGAVSSVMLLPLRRFMPSVTMYYPPEQEDTVLGALGAYLPQEERSSDAIDKLMRKVRF